MKNIALVSPGILPVPTVKGGAVEVLIQHLIDCNENEKRCNFTLYTVADAGISPEKYKNTKIVQIQQGGISRFIYKCINFVFRKLRIPIQLNYYNQTVSSMIATDNFDEIIVQNSPGVFEAVHKATSGKIPITFHMHNNIDRNRTLERCQYVVQHSNRVVVISEYLKRHLNSNIPNKHTDIVYNCVNQQKFNPDRYNGRALRQSLLIADDEIVFLFSGRVNEDKGVRELVKAFRNFCQVYDKAKLLVVGSSWFEFVAEDAYLTEVKKLAGSLGNRIIFTGYKRPDEMPEIYAAADVVVIPSMWEEPFGVVGLEAMSMGKPIITTDSGGLIEFLNEENAMIVHRKKFDQEMPEAMLCLAKDAERRQIMGNKARADLLSRPEFDHRNYLDNFLGLLERSNHEL